MTTIDVTPSQLGGRVRVGLAGVGHAPRSGPC